MGQMVVFIKIDAESAEGIFKKRLTRFSALVRLDNKIYEVFLPNPGRLDDLLKSGVKVILKENAHSGRKTAYDLIGVYHKGRKVSVDSRVPNKLILEALKRKALKEFVEYDMIKPEASYGHTRFDFLLCNNQESCFLEVKSCTLVKKGIAEFPDAKTKRGTRHVLDLVKAKKEGYRACLLFLIQRTDAYAFSPNDTVDPEFGKALRKAVNRGVEVYAYFSKFVGNKIRLKDKVKVVL